MTFHRVVNANQQPTVAQRDLGVDVTAYGTSEGVKKAWNSRQRGQKALRKYAKDSKSAVAMNKALREGKVSKDAALMNKEVLRQARKQLTQRPGESDADFLKRNDFINQTVKREFQQTALRVRVKPKKAKKPSTPEEHRAEVARRDARTPKAILDVMKLNRY